jgi:hypothetical protein
MTELPRINFHQITIYQDLVDNAYYVVDGLFSIRNPADPFPREDTGHPASTVQLFEVDGQGQFVMAHTGTIDHNGLRFERDGATIPVRICAHSADLPEGARRVVVALNQKVSPH